jgi:hypothetical protein
MLDKEGYPTDKTLQKLRQLNPFHQPIKEIIETIIGNWYGDAAVYDAHRQTLELHTEGWSGNEDAIAAIRDSGFWMLFWQSTVRGGHYYFVDIKPPENSTKWGV